MLKKATILSLLALISVPFFAFAQAFSIDTNAITSLLTQVQNILGLAVPIVIGIGLIVFLWGLMTYIRGTGKDSKEARNLMVWGIVILAVMVSVWGLVRILQNFVGVESSASDAPDAPEIPEPNL